MNKGQAQAPPCRPDAAVFPLLEQQQQQPCQGDHSLQRQALHGAASGGLLGGTFPWLPAVVLLVLTFNSGMAIYRSEGDPWSIAFVLFSYGNLTLLFACLRAYEREADDDDDQPGRRDRLKVAVWLLTTTLTAAFSYKVAAIMPLPVAALVWTMAFATVAGGYYAFFVVHTEK